MTDKICCSGDVAALRWLGIEMRVLEVGSDAGEVLERVENCLHTDCVSCKDREEGRLLVKKHLDGGRGRERSEPYLDSLGCLVVFKDEGHHVMARKSLPYWDRGPATRLGRVIIHGRYGRDDDVHRNEARKLSIELAKATILGASLDALRRSILLLHNHACRSSANPLLCIFPAPALRAHGHPVPRKSRRLPSLAHIDGRDEQSLDRHYTIAVLLSKANMN
jgi:hypothetical protein